jgi:3-oxoadipate enol-lactonase
MDTRDTGLSGDGGDRYTMSTLADDALTVLNHADIDRAHVLGFSMGGIVVTDLASRRPDRVRSCIFLSAMSPDPNAGMGDQFFASLDEHDAVAATLAAMGSPTDEDRAWVSAELARSIERAPARPEAGARHQAAAFRLGWPQLDALARIDAPALAIHGTHDRSLPVAHARAFEREMPNAHAVYVDGMGHLPTRAEWQRIAQLVGDHLASVHDRA